MDYATIARSTSPAEHTTPYSSPPRSLTPLLYVGPDPPNASTESYSPEDAYEETMARSKREIEEWEIMFRNMSRAPTPLKSPPPPDWSGGWRSYGYGYAGSSSSDSGTNRTGYLTPKSRSRSPSRRVVTTGTDSEFFITGSSVSNSDSCDVAQMDEGGTDADDYDESDSVVDSRTPKYSNDQSMNRLRDEGDSQDEEMQGAVDESIENELSPVNLEILDSKLTKLASRTAVGTRRRKVSPSVQISPRVTRSATKRRKDFELVGQ
ncbi:hypothetical protein J3R30DRAFT_636843 [Lentinula aciculospora]|uniref:Uncharacterized protein n=1 Tax=Lentinula aciculospora TaxID=153920 RepID=A0A9W9DKH6_9AGAR|nr:hypothetical protein J3R30DRAFT_636843 [Lentinula aciculospora]